MWPSDLSWVGVVVAAAAYFVLGAVWYGVLAKPWMKFSGKDYEEVQNGAGALTYVTAALTSLLCAACLGAVLKLCGAVTLADHICVAGTCGLGMVSAASAKHYAFLGFKPGLLLIDGGYDTAGFVAMGAILFAL